jgi:hypothetical protein
MPRIAKLDAASRQLDAAIFLLFANGDPIAVHTLAVAATNIFSDVLDTRVGAQSWREKLRLDHGLSHAQVRDVMHKAWNFFKHADRDPGGIFEFDERESEHIIFFATLECGEIQVTSIPMQTYQLWFLASGALDLGPDDEIQRSAHIVFPTLKSLSRTEQLRAGAEMVAIQTQGSHAET